MLLDVINLASQNQAFKWLNALFRFTFTYVNSQCATHMGVIRFRDIDKVSDRERERERQK